MMTAPELQLALRIGLRDQLQDAGLLRFERYSKADP